MVWLENCVIADDEPLSLNFKIFPIVLGKLNNNWKGLSEIILVLKPPFVSPTSGIGLILIKDIS